MGVAWGLRALRNSDPKKSSGVITTPGIRTAPELRTLWLDSTGACTTFSLNLAFSTGMISRGVDGGYGEDKQAISRSRVFPPSAFPLRLEFSIAADVELIPSAVEQITVLALENGYAPDQELPLRLALQEVFANAVVHGCGGDISKSVHCLAALDDQLGLLVRVRDDGPGFDVAGPDLPLDNSARYADHGRGLYLVRELMDEVWHERGGSEIYVRKYASREGSRPVR